VERGTGRRGEWATGRVGDAARVKLRTGATCAHSCRPVAPSPLLPFFPSPSRFVVTRFVTRRLTRFGSAKVAAYTVSFKHTVYGYPRGPEALARALPM
jgi:hypothetical protein